jgi:hypothetical protein
MATLAQVESAFLKADAAGDTAAATVLAGEVRRLRAQSEAPTEKPSRTVGQRLGDLAAGAVRGAGSIGATLLAPVDAAARAVGVENEFVGRRDRREAMTGALQDLGADTDSLAFKGGKLATEVAGTLGTGGAVANTVARVAPRFAAAAPNLLTAIRTSGMEAGSGNALVRAAGGGLSGGAAAGLVNPDEAATGAAVGAALPPALQLAGKAGRAVGAAVRGGGVSPEVAALAQRAKELGIDIPADRLVQSKPLDAVSSALNYVPFSGRAATEAKMSEQLNRALSRTFGQDSSNVTQALRRADSALGGQFDEFLRSNTVRIDDAFLDKLASAVDRAAKELAPDQASIIAKQADEILSKGAAGAIDGQAAYNIKKTLDRIGGRNSPEAWYALDLKRDLMEALNRSVGPEKAQGFAQLRQQYGNMLDLQKLAKNGAEGEISAARLANLKNINNEPLQELADIAAQFVRNREGQHGAAQRAAVGVVGAVTGGLPGLAVGAGAGRVANSALNSNALRALVMREPSSEFFSPGLRELVYRSAPVLAADR